MQGQRGLARNSEIVVMNARQNCILIVLLSFHAVTWAQIFKCRGANDRYIVQGTPCDADVRALDPKKPAAENKRATVPWKRQYEEPGGNWELHRTPAPVTEYPRPQVIQSPVNTANPPQISSGREPRRNKAYESATQPALTETKAYKDLEAFGKMQRCNHERQQLGVLNSGRPVASYDNKGERHYVEDADRQGKIAAAERRVAEACN